MAAFTFRLEPVVEIYSDWGRFEWLLEDALRQGYRVGFAYGNSVTGTSAATTSLYSATNGAGDHRPHITAKGLDQTRTPSLERKPVTEVVP